MFVWHLEIAEAAHWQQLSGASFIKRAYAQIWSVRVCEH